MKIAFIVSEFPSLSQTFVLNQITGLIDRGQEITIFAKGIGNTARIHEKVIKYNLFDRTNYFLEIPHNRFLRFFKAFFLIFKYLPYNCLHILNSINFFKIGKDAFSLYWLFRAIPFLNRGAYDIIQCHFGSSGNIAVKLRDAGIISGKVVTTFHGYDLTLYLRKKGNRIYDKLFEKGDLFLPISENWKNVLIKLGCREDKIIVHRMGIETDNIQFLRFETKDPQTIKILSVGRLVEKKGITLGIQAISKLIMDFPNVEYLIIGSGPLKNDLINQINRLNLKDKIILLDEMTHEKIFDYMSKSHIFLAPSITSKSGDQEGIPVVLMEAMAHRLPVISTYHSGIPELVINGKTGFLVKEGNVREIVEKIKFIISNPKYWS